MSHGDQNELELQTGKTRPRSCRRGKMRTTSTPRPCLPTSGRSGKARPTAASQGATRTTVRHAPSQAADAISSTGFPLGASAPKPGQDKGEPVVSTARSRSEAGTPCLPSPPRPVSDSPLAGCFTRRFVSGGTAVAQHQTAGPPPRERSGLGIDPTGRVTSQPPLAFIQPLPPGSLIGRVPRGCRELLRDSLGLRVGNHGIGGRPRGETRLIGRLRGARGPPRAVGQEPLGNGVTS